MRVIVLAVLVSAGAIRAAGAQAADTVAMPTELVIALSGEWSMLGEAPRVVVGAAPPEFAGVQLPEDYRTIGGLSSAQKAVLVLDAPSVTDAARRLGASIAAAGWEPSPETRFFHGPADAPPVAFCRDGAALRIGGYAPYGARAIVRVELERSRAAQFRCTPRDEPPPVLRRLHGSMSAVPAGMRYMGGGGGGSGDSWESRFELAGSLPPSEVAEHYAGELERGGWQRTGDAVTAGPVASHGFAFVAEDGTRWSARLTVITLPGMDWRGVSVLARKADLSARLPRGYGQPCVPDPGC